MPNIIHLTDKPIKISGASDVIQDLRLALDVLEFDELDLMLHVQRLDGTGTPLSPSRPRCRTRARTTAG